MQKPRGALWAPCAPAGNCTRNPVTYRPEGGTSGRHPPLTRCLPCCRVGPQWGGGHRHDAVRRQGGRPAGSGAAQRAVQRRGPVTAVAGGPQGGERRWGGPGVVGHRLPAPARLPWPFARVWNPAEEAGQRPDSSQLQPGADCRHPPRAPAALHALLDTMWQSVCLPVYLLCRARGCRTWATPAS
jgi:hypothetical protein